MASMIEIDDPRDKVIQTKPSVKLDDRIEIVCDNDSPLKRSDSNSMLSDFEFLANAKKILPPPPPSTPVAAAAAGQSSSDHLDDPFSQKDGGADEPSKEGGDTKEGGSENERENERREKSLLLHEYEQINRDQIYSPKVLSMYHSLTEIKDELTFVRTKRSTEQNLSYAKMSLMFLSQSIVHLNNHYDPLDVDLSDWGADMKYHLLQERTYDDVLLELVQKYDGKLKVSPELKLVTMFVGGLGYGILRKKQDKAALLKRMQEKKEMEKMMRNYAREEYERQQQEHAQYYYSSGSGRPSSYPSGSGGRPSSRGPPCPPPPSHRSASPPPELVSSSSPPPRPIHSHSASTMKGPTASPEDFTRAMMESTFIHDSSDSEDSVDTMAATEAILQQNDDDDDNHSSVNEESVAMPPPPPPMASSSTSARGRGRGRRKEPSSTTAPAKRAYRRKADRENENVVVFN